MNVYTCMFYNKTSYIQYRSWNRLRAVILMKRSSTSIIWTLICFMSLQWHHLRASQLLLSLNCGGDAFNDTTTTFEWVSDGDYVVNGINGNVAADLASLADPVYRTLRYFPSYSRKNNKFCYTLPGLVSSKLYLIRAGFFYGNYDGLNRPPSFSLLLNYDIWIPNVNTSSSTNDPVLHEIIYVSLADVAYVCLAPVVNGSSADTTTPFISSLELRLLETNMYNRFDDANNSTVGASGTGGLITGHALLLFRRINYGAATNASIRYPDDPYDRIWEANTTTPVESVASANFVVNTSVNVNRPPLAVMKTAIAGSGVDGALEIEVEGYVRQSSGGLYIAFHFADLSEDPSVIKISEILGSVGNFSEVPLNATGGVRAQAIDQNLGQTLSVADFTAKIDVVNGTRAILNALELLTWTSQPLRTNATAPSDVQGLEDIQHAFDLTSFGDGDPCLPVGYAWTWITCSADSVNLRVIEINLTNFNIQGEISQFNFNSLTKLQKIFLADNELNGSIPDLSSLQDLQLLDLRNNRLSGQILISLAQLPRLKQVYLDGNLELCGSIPLLFQQKNINITYSMNSSLCNVGMSCTCLTSTTTTSSSRKSSTTKYVIVVSILATVYVASIVAILLFCEFRRRRVHEKIKSDLYTTLVKDTREFLSIQYLQYEEIQDATNQFTNKIGEGGFGDVYFGTLKNNQHVAIKLLTDNSGQGMKEFNSEVAVLSKVHHKNLVSLLGYSTEKSYALVYEYLPGGNLQDNLYGDASKDKPLSWETRLSIAIDTAIGLEYLHVGCDPSIIHRDVKSSNILLTKTMQPKVADFGFSRLKGIDSTKSHISTQNVMGTPGYLDPEYHYTNQFTDKSDVYSFGVVLFELICGRRPIDSFYVPPHIIAWVTPLIMNNQIEDIVDPKLNGGYKLESIKVVGNIALKCVSSSRNSRPTISEVIQHLREAQKLENNVIISPKHATSSTNHNVLEGKAHSKDVSTSINSNASDPTNFEIETQKINLAR